MPDRIVRASIITSEPVNGISFEAEVFYRRLMHVVDDHGRYDGRISILRANLYPLQLERASESDVEKWKKEASDAGLIQCYISEGKPFVAILKFGQRVRGKSRWPDPPADNGGHALTFDSDPQTNASSNSNSNSSEYAGHALTFDSDPQAAIPSVEEVISYGKSRLTNQIPESYCRHYHAKKDEAYGWIRNGRLMKWESELCRWWEGDKHGWGKKGGQGKPKLKGPNI